MLVAAVSSVRLLQATSAAFTGGAAVLPPVQAGVTEQTPLLQDRSRRQAAWHKAMQPADAFLGSQHGRQRDVVVKWPELLEYVHFC